MYTRENTFTDDVLYQIMLFLPLNDIKSLCITDVDANKLCKDKHFWADKMTREDIPLLDVSMPGYKKLKLIYDIVLDKITKFMSFSLIQDKRLYNNAYPEYVNISKDIIKLLPQRLIDKLPDKEYISISIYPFSGPYYTMKMHYKNDYHTLTLKQQALIDFLIKVYYYNPTIKIY